MGSEFNGSLMTETTHSDLGRKAFRQLLLKNVIIAGIAAVVTVPATVLFEEVAGAAEPARVWPQLLSLCVVVQLVAMALLYRAARPLKIPPEQISVEAAKDVFRLARHAGQLHFLSWSATAAFAALFVYFAESFRPDRTLMVFLACLLTGIAASLAAHIRTRTLLTQVWADLSLKLSARGAQFAVARASLRQKITLVLGGVVFFSSAFGLYSSFALQREIASFYATRQGDELARTVQQMVQRTAAEPCKELASLSPANGALIFAGKDVDCRVGVPLSEDVLTGLQRGKGKKLSVPSVNLEGVRYRMGDAVLVLLFPKPEWARRVLLISFLFYTLLFLFSAYLASQVARELSAPILELGRQVRRIEQGDLSGPIAAVSSDEIGDLGASMEAMRRGLKEMVETIRSLNLTLEEKVMLRTAELEEANDSLTSTLNELKHTQTRLVHAEKMASLGRLMSGLAHELNNPVNAIVNNAGPLQEKLARLAEDESADAGVSRLHRAAKVVEHAAQRTVDLIATLATFSRPDEQVRKPTDINAAIEATLMLLQHRVDERGTRVHLELGELPEVTCHPGEVNQVLMNLLANAIEAVAERGDKGSVTINSVAAGEDRISVTVEDNGNGISEEHLSRIFEPFFTTRDEGTGLGLAISHEIVTRHGGVIAVESQAGRTVFALSLPVS